MYLHRPIIADPPLCSLRELQDGTYSLDDLITLHEILDVRSYLKEKSQPKR